MKLLNISLPNVTRLQYANLKSQQIWEQKINTGKKFYPQMEYLTVKHGVRPCMIAHGVDPNSLDKYMRQLSKDGLLLVPVAKEPANNGNFSHVQDAYNGSGKFTYRCVVTKTTELADKFADAHNNRDDVTIGELLGFPKESSEFFQDVWAKGYFDPIWQQAENTVDHEIFKNKREFVDPSGEVEKKLIRFKSSDENWKISSVFRYIGIRTISHFPKSFDDAESIKVSNDWIQLGRDLNIEGLNETLEIMQLPYEWDCLKGLAVINTPVFKIVTTSMPCYPNHIIQQESDYYPEEAPNGVQFPWRNPLFSIGVK